MVLEVNVSSQGDIIRGLEKIVLPDENSVLKIPFLQENFLEANKLFEKLYSLIPEYFPNIDFKRLKLLRSDYDSPVFNQAHTTFSIPDLNVMSKAISSIVNLLKEYTNNSIVLGVSEGYQIQPFYRR